MIYENPKVIKLESGQKVVLTTLRDDFKPCEYVLIRHLNLSGHNSIVAFGNDKKNLNDVIEHLNFRFRDAHQTYFICKNSASRYTKDVALLNICKTVANCLECVDINLKRGNLVKARNIYKFKISNFLFDAQVIFFNYGKKK